MRRGPSVGAGEDDERPKRPSFPEPPDATSISLALVVEALCPDPCPQVYHNSDLPCPAVAAMANRDHLTPREREALWLVCLGLKNASIAVRMGVTEATVRLHLRNLHRKTRTSDKVDVVRKAWRFCVKNTRAHGWPATYRKR